MFKLLLQFLLSIFLMWMPALASAQSGGGTTSGAKEYCETTNSGFISVSGYTGSIVDWEVSTNGGASWNPTGTVVSVKSYSDLATTTCYKAVVKNGASAPVRSTVSCIVINEPTVAGTISGGGLFCDSTGTGILHLTQNKGKVMYWKYSTNNGLDWNQIASNSLDLSYPNSVKNIVYKAFVQNGPSCKLESSADARFVVAPSYAGLIEGGGSFCTESGSGVLHLKGAVGTVLYWQYKINNGPVWMQINDTNKQLKYASIRENMQYRVVVRNGSTCRADTAAPVAFINASSIAGVVSGATSVCPESNKGKLILKGNNGDPFWLNSTDNGISWNKIADKQIDLTYNNLKQNTLFKAVVINGSCKGDTSATVAISVLPKTEVHAGRDTVVLGGKTIQLKGSGKGIPEWEPVSGLSSKEVFEPYLNASQSAVYILKVRDNNGCVNTDSVSVEVVSLVQDGIITNVFTPNGDGINDTWFIRNLHLYPSNEVFVYNTFGTLVFHKQGYNNDWTGTYKGKDLVAGVYYYVLKINGLEKGIVGTLELLDK